MGGLITKYNTNTNEKNWILEFHINDSQVHTSRLCTSSEFGCSRRGHENSGKGRGTQLHREPWLSVV